MFPYKKCVPVKQLLDLHGKNNGGEILVAAMALVFCISRVPDFQCSLLSWSITCALGMK